jgi:hypothetical protein
MIVIARSAATKQSSLSWRQAVCFLFARFARAGLLRQRRSEATPFFERLWLAMTGLTPRHLALKFGIRRAFIAATPSL